jgi:hypothetical protein
MTIREHIQMMLKYPNLDAELNFVVNTTNSEDDAFDIENCEVSYMEQDKEDVAYYDVLVHLPSEEEEKRNERSDESISSLLGEHRKLTIELDADALHKNNIVILDEEDNVLREIEVGGRHRQEENIAIILNSILG